MPLFDPKKLGGLSSSEVQSRLQTFGFNILKQKSARRWYHMLLDQFKDLLVLILILAALVSLFHDTLESLVILVVVLLNAFIGFFQEFRTERTLQALKKMVSPEVRVIRDGREQKISTENLVPEDLVILGEGDRVPADGILLQAFSLKCDEAVLTGESLPLEKKEKDLVFMGTSVARGSGLFQVTKTGMNTEFGKITELTTSTGDTKSPLEIELEHIALFVTKLTGGLCLILFLVEIFDQFQGGTLDTDSIFESLIFSVSVAVAAVPEGLPTTITVALALGASILAKKKAVVKKLSSVQTLGVVSTICSDKTGTLTKNQMTVRSFYLPHSPTISVEGVGYDPTHGKVRMDSPELLEGLKKSAQICVFCNEAKLIHEGEHWKILGDPTEGALLTFAEKCRHLAPQFDHQFKTKDLFPFDSDRKMMSIVVEKEGELRVLSKGSPDQLLERCTHFFDGNSVRKIEKKDQEAFLKIYQDMASDALRVLALAYKPIEKAEQKITQESAEKDLIFCGLVGMIDPPRDEVKSAVKKCHEAGIRVIVITGDYGITAQAIARELGILGEDHEGVVLTGDEVKILSDEVLSEKLKDRSRSIIFARSLPDQKMRIVELLQKQGEIVAMTGDGVNDAPALKKANIGVAMGITGTEVSKEAATMVLMNDSFASIVTAVEEGRRIYDNLRRFVWFIFSCNIGELFVVFSAIILKLPLPLSALMILCINLGTDILPAIALGVEYPEKGVMNRPPRRSDEKVMNRSFVRSFLTIGCTIGLCSIAIFYYIISFKGWNLGDSTEGDFAYAQTMVFASLTVIQLFNAFAVRSFRQSIFSMNPFKNHWLVGAVLFSALFLGVLIYVPFFNLVIGTVPLSFFDWDIILLSALIPVFVFEAIKRVTRSNEQIKILG